MMTLGQFVFGLFTAAQAAQKNSYDLGRGNLGFTAAQAARPAQRAFFFARLRTGLCLTGSLATLHMGSAT